LDLFPLQRKRNTPRIASVYERTHAALKGIAGEGADIVSHYQDTEGDQISSAQEAKGVLCADGSPLHFTYSG
jgi:hypothetical protein